MCDVPFASTSITAAWSNKPLIFGSKEMKRQVMVGLLILLTISGFAAADDLPYRRGELLVRFKQIAVPPEMGPLSTCAVKSTVSNLIVPSTAVTKEYDRIAPGLALVELPEGTTVEDAFLQFNSSANVLYAQPNYKRRLYQLYPADPFFSRQWGLHNTGQTVGTPDADIDAPEAWETIFQAIGSVGLPLPPPQDPCDPFGPGAGHSYYRSGSRYRC